MPVSGLKATLLGALERNIQTRFRCGVCGTDGVGWGTAYASSVRREGGGDPV